MNDSNEPSDWNEEDTESLERSDRPPFQFKDIRVVGADLLSVPWYDLIKPDHRQRIECYSTDLFAAASEAEKSGDLLRQQVLVLLASASSMCYDPDDRDEPFKPALGTCSTCLVDFNDPHLDAIAEAYEQIADNEMRARLADILWVRRRVYAAAQTAVSAYLEQAKFHMDPAEWVHGFRRLRRAMQIAGSLGNRSAEREAVVRYASELLAKLDATDPSFLTGSIISLLLDYEAGDPAMLAVYAKKAALNAAKREEWIVAADYGAIVSRCTKGVGDAGGGNVN